MTHRLSLHEAALAYGEMGWHVFPLVPREKRPATAHGFKDATDDEAVIDMWWGNQPKSNVGIACGASGLVVLDVDPRNGGQEAFDLLKERHDIPESWRVETGGGGFHVYFRQPDTQPVGKTVLASGLDLVAKGAYVVAPPSTHPSGRQYQWLVGPGHLPSRLEVCPGWLVDYARGTKQLASVPSTGIGFDLPSEDELEEITKGRRNEMLARTAGAMRRWGMSDKAIYAGLTVHNQEVCRPPLPEDEVRRIAASISRYEPEDDGDEGSSEGESDYRVSIEVPHV